MKNIEDYSQIILLAGESPATGIYRQVYARKTWQRWHLCNENVAKVPPMQGKRGFTRRGSACIIYPKQLLQIEQGGAK